MLEWAENMGYASTDFKFIFISIEVATVTS